ncbi:hypothetical protein GCM10009798_17780 [Nocardioides panacihumi]|uniref:DUF202 domain-containing protein n=1 Tax=Nocardioides panacihumi TaxID=400774 RepID=A0ABN2QV01_9ACTN
MSAAPAGLAAEEEPDYRFTLANERTFLAWIRTALALVAGGVAVGQVSATGDTGRVLVVLLAITCLVTALVLAFGAPAHWRRSQAAIRRGLPLPGTRLIAVLVLAVVVLAAAGTALLLVT